MRSGSRTDSAEAFAPAVISNFFAIHDEGLASRPPDYRAAGATGGGFTLSSGVVTRAVVEWGPRTRLRTKVNGDPRYPAKTTVKAVELLLQAARVEASVTLEQDVQVPIGYGFGSSSASSLSAVMAVNAALGLGYTKERTAFFAHCAEIICGTGLGTVSSTYDHAGAGVVERAGAPGFASVREVDVPSDARVVTACLPSARSLKTVLSSRAARERVNTLGEEALERASFPPTFDSLLKAGATFSAGLGLETPAIKRLLAAATGEETMGAAQNMVGRAIHVVVREENVQKILRALRRTGPSARLGSFGIGGARASVLAP